MSGLFATIRKSCAEVAAQARWVSIDRARLAQYAEVLQFRRGAMAHTAEHHLLGRGDDTLVYFLILDTINFGSGYSPHLDKGGEGSGYFMVARRLTEFCQANGVPRPQDLARLDTKECARIFRQDLANPHAAELMWLFALALNDLGEWVMRDHGGDYLGFLKRARRLEDAVSAVLAMAFFRDEARHGRTRVLFLKRAQILLQDMKVAEPDHALLAFDDFHELTVFADNLVPFVLKADGILRYDPWLEKRIQNDEIIGAGSLEEIEMRAGAVQAAELLKEHLNETIGDVTSRELDHCLWNRGQLLKTRSADKPHRTRCVYY